MSRISQILIAAALPWLLICTVQAASLRVTVLVADDGAAYQEFVQSLTDGAKQQNISLTILRGDIPLPDSDLIVAVGIKSAIAAINSQTPVLCVLISKAGFEKLQHDLLTHPGPHNFSAVYLDQPGKRQIDLITAVLPEAKNIGLLFSTQSPDISNFRKVIADRQLKLQEQMLQSPESLHQNLQSVLQKSDVLLAIPDTQIYNASTLRNILLATYYSKVPLVGFSQAYVRAGALCAVFSTPQQIATQALYMTKQFAETGQLPAVQYPSEFEVMVNQQVARSLGIQIKVASELVKDLKAAEGGGK